MTNDLKQPLKAKLIKIKPRHWTFCPSVLRQKKIHYSPGRAIQSETKGIHFTQLIPHPSHRPSIEYRSWHIPMAHFNPLVAGQVFRYTMHTWFSTSIRCIQIMTCTFQTWVKPSRSMAFNLLPLPNVTECTPYQLPLGYAFLFTSFHNVKVFFEQHKKMIP